MSESAEGLRSLDERASELQRAVNLRLNQIDDTKLGPIGKRAAADFAIASMIPPYWEWQTMERLGRTPQIVITRYRGDQLDQPFNDEGEGDYGR